MFHVGRFGHILAIWWVHGLIRICDEISLPGSRPTGIKVQGYGHPWPWLSVTKSWTWSHLTSTSHSGLCCCNQLSWPIGRGGGISPRLRAQISDTITKIRRAVVRKAIPRTLIGACTFLSERVPVSDLQNPHKMYDCIKILPKGFWSFEHSCQSMCRSFFKCAQIYSVWQEAHNYTNFLRESHTIFLTFISNIP